MSKIFLWCDCSYTKVGLQSLLYKMFRNDCSVIAYDDRKIKHIEDIGFYIFVVSSDNFFKVASFLKDNELQQEKSHVVIISTANLFEALSRVCNVLTKKISIRSSLLKMAKSLRVGEAERVIRRDEITRKELQVVDLLMSGRTLTEVAFYLNRSIKTISTHKKNFLMKLGLGNNLVMLRDLFQARC